MRKKIKKFDFHIFQDVTKIEVDFLIPLLPISQGEFDLARSFEEQKCYSFIVSNFLVRHVVQPQSKIGCV